MPLPFKEYHFHDLAQCFECSFPAGRDTAFTNAAWYICEPGTIAALPNRDLIINSRLGLDYITVFFRPSALSLFFHTRAILQKLVGDHRGTA